MAIWELLQAGASICSVIAGLWARSMRSIETTADPTWHADTQTQGEQHWPSSSHTRAATESASAPTTDYLPFLGGALSA